MIKVIRENTHAEGNPIELLAELTALMVDLPPRIAEGLGIPEEDVRDQITTGITFGLLMKKGMTPNEAKEILMGEQK